MRLARLLLPALVAASADAAPAGLPDLAQKKITQYQQQGKAIDVVAFAPGGHWVLVAEGFRYYSDAKHFTANGLRGKLEQYLAGKKRIDAIAFTPQGDWVIVAGTHRFYSNRTRFNTMGLRRAIEQTLAAKRRVDAIAIGSSNSWALVSNGRLQGKNLPTELAKCRIDCIAGRRRVHTVSLSGRRWFVGAGDYFAYGGLTAEAKRRLASYRARGRHVDHVVLAPKNGWSIVTNRKVQASDDPVGLSFERGVGRSTIYQRMVVHNVPGVSLAVIKNNRIAWARAYGVKRVGTDRFIHTRTLFAAASISKAVASAGLLILEQDGKIDRNTSIRAYASRFKNSRFGRWADSVIRDPGGVVYSANMFPYDLLSHTAGLNVRGIGLYPRNAVRDFWFARRALPNLENVLFGTRPATGSRVRFVRAPRTAWQYSGGGYSVAEALMEAVSGQSFPAFMKARVLSQLGMGRSTFGNPPKSERESFAYGHDKQMRPLPIRVCPGRAAGGLVTTPTDYARFVIMVLTEGRRSAGSSARLLTTTNARRLRTARVDAKSALFRNSKDNAVEPYGLGMKVFGDRFAHGGTQGGYKTYFIGDVSRKSGLVVMTNGHADRDLVVDLFTSRPSKGKGAWPLIKEIRRSYRMNVR